MSLQRPKLSDVAREAGVSSATVSRCLNGSGFVGADARARIFAAVERLGYLPNLGARALASRRSRTVGAVVPTLSNSIFARGLQAFQDELAKADTTLLVASSNYDQEEERSQIEAMVARGVDGLLLIGTARSPDVERFLARHAVPHVLAWTSTQDDRACVGFDNRAAAHEMASAVVAAGHTRIAMVAGRTGDNDRAASRVRGVRDALAEAGLGPVAVVEADYTLEAAATALDEIVARDEGVSAILGGNDVLGVGVVRRAKERGLHVPGDLAVTGFDDIEIARIVSPALTTVHVPHERMGTESALLLAELMRGEAPAADRRLETSIVWRESFPKP